ncbi:acyl-CoA dehydrogenase family protein [Actinophytocola oryzae]|uniref:Alkylation response protein AidB-like acyl-CoA dehydrogenase n=1 Tax=Actinophytocola oryzae TaxID=502181 RepID=A0A4R7W5L5_9PSEU|nr:acyl-CoA dehydrogenase family protein [Actinophytocola oryzae]TDV57545.1 alkylation response protein AidB-like acyl-CoA dehydrogenase [Actinophytocola oryzae]
MGELDDLRRTVRGLVADWDITPTCDSWMRGHDPAFSRAMAERGLIGITWPEPFGGGRSNLARLVVTEELLRVGAPVGAHWIADRQIGPAVLRNGSPALRREVLPGIAAGEITFCLGMSETEAGSDLASVRTRAVRDGDGWRITGSKIWTTGAHFATHAYVLARTGDGADKHEGLTEFVVEMSAPGVTVRPIEDLGGGHHFNEVTFDDVLVPAGRVIGAEGAGWKQVTEQLSFERGGMERVLSTYPLLAAVLGSTVDDRVAVGTLAARLMTLRELACRVAEAMDDGRAPSGEAAVLKFLGTTFERDVIDVARTAPGRAAFAPLLAQAQLAAPGFSIRGGTDEMLMTVVSRQAPAPVVDDIGRMADDVLASAPDPWAAAVELGWTSVGVDEAAGGSGGTFADLAALVRALGRHGHAVPLAEVAVARMLTGTPAVAALGPDDVWAGHGAAVVLGESSAALYPSDGEPWHGLAGQPRRRIAGEPTELPVPEGLDPVARLTVLRVHAALGTVEGACRLTREHVTTRVQFGRPLNRLQAVAHRLAEMECARVLLEVAASAALGLEPTRVAAAATVLDPVATLVARFAHQLHGAMGITRESPLHRYTTLLWSLRDEVGAREWAPRLCLDEPALWHAVTTRPVSS